MLQSTLAFTNISEILFLIELIIFLALKYLFCRPIYSLWIILIHLKILQLVAQVTDIPVKITLVWFVK